MKNFILDCLSGDALYDEIDDYIDYWHNHSDLKIELHEFLGMSEKEYSYFLTNSDCLRNIFHAKEYNLDIDKVMIDYGNATTYSIHNASKDLSSEQLNSWIDKKVNNL